MSSRPTTPAAGKLALPMLGEMKRSGRPIVMVTAYDHASAAIASEAGVDLILVGDSAAMTVLGYESTVPVGMDEMLMLTAAAVRGATHPLVVADLPFLSYQTSDRDAVLSAGRFLKEAGADAVKLEGGGGAALDRIRAVSGAGIPVMAHLGLTPQSATALGGYKAQGRTTPTALGLLHDALAVEAAGAFAVVLECVPAVVATRITERLAIPTVGIGAGAGCDGQVLVFHDLLGLGGARPPRFVKQYAALRERAVGAVGRYAREVRDGAFPTEQHTYAMAEGEQDAFEAAVVAANPLGD
jgi:3-methyl-2-oxobutanoate hydroxymethyltransferase